MKKTKMIGVLTAFAIMMLGTTIMVSASSTSKNGWVKEGNEWYYYVKNKAITNNWASSGNDEYFLGEDGAMVTNAIVDNYDKVVLDIHDLDDIDAENSDYYYLGKDGAMVSGWQLIELENQEYGPTNDKSEKKWYYFSKDGIMYGSAWILSGNDWYYVLENGQMAENYLLEDYKYEDYYFGDNGVMITGWYQLSEDDEDAGLGLEDSWIYASSNGDLKKEGWKKVKNDWYYFGVVSSSSLAVDDLTETSGKEYIMQENKYIEDENGYVFYLDKDGAMATGWIKVRLETSAGKETKYYHANENGTIEGNKVKKISSKYNYFGDDCFLVNADGKFIIELKDGGYSVIYDKLTDAEAAAVRGDVIYKLGTGTKYSK